MNFAIYSSAAFSSASGVEIAGNAEVEIRREDNGDLATIYEDHEGDTPLSNPFNADAFGRFSFYAEGIEFGYRVKVTIGSEEYTLRNQPIGLNQYSDTGGGGGGVEPGPITTSGLTMATDRILGRTTAGTGAIEELDGGLVPTGTLLDFGGTSAPTGFLACDGSNVSRTTYAALFAAIGTTWGAGDGATTFTLPDFRRRVAVGSGGTGSGTLGNAVGNTGGAEAHTLSIAEMPSHNHPSAATYTLDGSYTQLRAGDAGSPAGAKTGGNTGGGGAHNNMQPSAVVLKIIKA